MLEHIAYVLERIVNVPQYIYNVLEYNNLGECTLSGFSEGDDESVFTSEEGVSSASISSSLSYITTITSAAAPIIVVVSLCHILVIFVLSSLSYCQVEKKDVPLEEDYCVRLHVV